MATDEDPLRSKWERLERDLKIRPCTPPIRETGIVIFPYCRRCLSAVVEQEEAPIAQQDEARDVKEAVTAHRKPRKEDPPIIMVFWDDHRHRREVELSHHQENVLCKLWNKSYAVCCIFPSGTFAYN